MAVRFNSVQTSLAKYATERLSRDLNTKIHIGKVSITPIKSIELLDFYVLDQENDTVIQTKSMSILAKNINLKKNRIEISSLRLNEANVQLIKRKGKSGFSFQFILDYFDSGAQSEHNNSNFLVGIQSIELSNSRFRFKDYRTSASYYGMDFANLDAKPINLTFSNFRNKGSNIQVDIEHLSTVEKSKFDLRNLTGIVEIDSNFVHINKLEITTANSHISTEYFRFEFDQPSYFEDDFENKVTMKTSFEKTRLNLADLAFFTSFFDGIDKEVLLTGEFNGTVADFKTRNLVIQIDKQSKFIGNLDIKGLPYTENTTFDLFIRELKTTESELNNLDIPPFDKKQKLQLPPEISGIGNMNLAGTMKGKFDDFVSALECQTSQGKIALNARYWHQNKTDHLKGTLITDKLNMGSFAKNPDLAEVDAHIETELSWNSRTGINLIAKGELPQLTYKGHSYKNIKIDGAFTEKSFDGKASIKDAYGGANFIGFVNFESQIPEFDFQSNISQMNLSKLNILKDSNQHIVSGDIRLKGHGSSIDNSTGVAKISNLIYQQNEKTYRNKEIKVTSSKKENSQELKLLSDVADGSIKGQFSLSQLGTIADIIGQQVVPALYASKDSVWLTNQSFDFNLIIKDYSPIQELFTPDLEISNNTKALGSFDSSSEKFRLSLSADSISYLSNTFDGIEGVLDKPRDVLDLTIDISTFTAGNDFSLENLVLSSKIRENHITPSIEWNSLEGESYGKIQGNGYWYNEEYFDMLILPSSFHFKNRDWKIKEDASLIVDSSNFNFNGLVVTNNLNEGVSVVGNISENPEDVLKIYLDNFNVKYLNPFIGSPTTKYKGNINGSACITNVYENIEIISDFFIDSLQVNRELIGDLVFNTDWIEESKAMNIKGELLKNDLNTFDFMGYFYPFRKKQSLDFKCILQNTNLAFLNPYLVGQGISEINGKAKGKISVTGEPEAPLLEGEISLLRTGFNVNYLNTHYDFSGLMIIENNDIYTDNIIEIRDEENNLAFFNGAIIHDNFTDFNFNVFIEIPTLVYRKGTQTELISFEGSRKVDNKFIGLNTNIELNDDFYGKVYATGGINVEGYQDEIDITVNAKTEKGTSFTLPLYGSSDVTMADFVVFNTKDSSRKEEEIVNLEGINLDINVEVTPEANLQLIFDEVYGDIISGTGYGNLSMTVDKQDQFNMAGKYTIEKGDYLFTLGLERFENLINKKFEIANASTINWYGDPYNAEIDINAIYKLKASMYEIMPQLTNNINKYKSRSDIEVVMELTENLMSPNIDFLIEVTRADETERAVIGNLMQTKQELNKQVFALLLLNRFLPSQNSNNQNGVETSGAVGTTASELLSNQLSNWMSKLSNNVDVGFNYRPGDDITSDEIAVALSTELLNERLVISSNFGVAQGNEINQNENALIGDVNVEYKLNEDGTFRVRVFTRTNDYDITNANQAQTTSGVGVYYKKEFNTWKEFITRKKKLKERVRQEP